MRRFDIHGVGLEVMCPEPELDVALSRRLSDFEVSRLEGPSIRFMYELVAKPSAHVVSRPDGPSRAVYDPPSGEVAYFPEIDTLYIEPDNSLRVVCDARTSGVRISLTEAALADIWLLSRPLFTLPLIELMKRHGLYSVHAAAVATEGRAILFAGGTGAGKSTLAVAHTQRGFNLLGDDLVFLRSQNDALTILAFRDEVDLTQETASWFPALADLAGSPIPAGWRKHGVRPETLNGSYEPTAAPTALIFPTLGATTSALEPLSRREALIGLAPNILLTDPATSQLHLDALSALVAQTICFRLATGRDFDRIVTLVRDVSTNTSPKR